MKLVGDLCTTELLNNKEVGSYIEPETGAIKASVWQGTAGLVLNKGKTAFKDKSPIGTNFSARMSRPAIGLYSGPGMLAASGSRAGIDAWSRTRCSTWWSTTRSDHQH